MNEGCPKSSADFAELQREIVEERKFSLEEAVARMAGPGAMKGESPVSRLHQAEFEIEAWVLRHCVDSSGALKSALLRQIKGSEILLDNFDQPLSVLSCFCRRILNSEYLLEELVRDADSQWGRLMGEQPHFERKGAPRHPDDPYTAETVRAELLRIRDLLMSQGIGPMRGDA